MSTEAESQGFIDILRRFSIPLIVGVVAAVLWANLVGEDAYNAIVYRELFDFSLFGRNVTVSPHWLINDIFMVFFFGVAAKEITDAMLPGGALNPPSKALNPIFGTIGGILGPVAVYLVLSRLLGGDDADVIATGWGIPTATDIALAWLVARVVFGASHPAVNFLLLLAIADDAIGLMIIAIFYPDPEFVVQPIWLLLTAAGVGTAIMMARAKVTHWAFFVFIAGTLSWLGLLRAGLHPALALVFIIPFMPSVYPDGREGRPSDAYHHAVGFPVDFGLFFFGLFNAGVAFGSVGAATWVVLFALLIGKPLGIGFFSILANAIGFKYPTGMGARHVVTVGFVAAMGLTVALFVAGQAFAGENIHIQPAAKMGALLSVLAAPVAFVVGKALRVKELEPGE